MTTALAIGGLSALVGYLWLYILYQRAKHQRDDAQKEASDLYLKLGLEISKAADTWSRLSRVITDLKADKERLEKELDKYAAKDPILAGDLLDSALSDGRVLPLAPSAPGSAGVQAGSSPGGGSSPPKPRG